MENKEIIIYCDGGSRGNPGSAASAFVVTQNNVLIFKGSKFLGITTNNVAEYTAVSIAVDWLINETIKDPVIFNLDSQLVERQLNGFYRIKDLKLKELFNNIKTKIEKNNLKIKFQWGYREKNTLADNLVNEELDRNTSR